MPQEKEIMMNTKYPKLLRPITLAGLTLKNRIFSAPTSLSELGPDTKYTREGIEYYKLRGRRRGGDGLCGRGHCRSSKR